MIAFSFPGGWNLYTSELVQSRKLAAKENYDAGVANEKLNTRISWKDAYFNYLAADRFEPGYMDVKERIPVAKYNAMLKVIVEQIPVPKSYQLTSDFFLNQIIENLIKNRPNEFVAFYSPESAEKEGVHNPDQILRMSFDEFTVGQIYDKETVRDFHRDSVMVGTVTLAETEARKTFSIQSKLK